MPLSEDGENEEITGGRGHSNKEVGTALPFQLCSAKVVVASAARKTPSDGQTTSWDMRLSFSYALMARFRQLTIVSKVVSVLPTSEPCLASWQVRGGPFGSLRPVQASVPVALQRS